MSSGTMASNPTPQLLGHPKGLFVCFFTEMWERFSFYGMKALLLLYLLKHHRFADHQAYLLLGAYAGLVYAVPVIGGLLADRYLGMRKAVVFGGILLCLGHLGMAYEGEAASIDAFGGVHRDGFGLTALYLSLSLIVCGVGFLKPNISTMVGLLYPANDPRRDSAYTLYYAGINLGALFASLICGYLGEVYGWRFGFGAAGIGMLAGLSVFVTGQSHLRGLAEPPHPDKLKALTRVGLSTETVIYGGTVLGVLVISALFRLPDLVSTVQYGMLVAWLLWFMWYVKARANPVQRGRMISILFFITFVLFFYALYEQTYASWVTFTDRMLNKDLFPTLVIRDGSKPLPWAIVPMVLSPFVVAYALRQRSHRLAVAALLTLTTLGCLFIIHDVAVLPQTAGSLTFLGALFIVLLAPLMSFLWPFLARRGLNPHKTTKCVIGLVLAGLAYLPLVAANDQAAQGHLASVWWLVLAYLILELGEVCLSPITLAAVSELTMPAVAGVMMSGWFLASSVSEQLAALFSSLASVEVQPGMQIHLQEAASKYGPVFHNMVWVGLATAALALALSPVMRRWMRASP